MPITVGLDMIFGISEREITDKNLILPNDCIYWRVDQGNDEFVTCVTVRREGATLIQERYFVTEHDEGEFSLTLRQDSVSETEGVHLFDIASGPPRYRDILIWIDHTEFPGKFGNDHWGIFSIEKRSFDDEKEELCLCQNGEPEWCLTDELHASLKWCDLPMNQPQQTEQ